VTRHPCNESNKSYLKNIYSLSIMDLLTDFQLSQFNFLDRVIFSHVKDLTASSCTNWYCKSNGSISYGGWC